VTNLNEEPQFETVWRRRFERFASENKEDHLVSGWSAAGLEHRIRLFLRLLEEQKVVNTTSVLDLGCGAGTYARALAGLGHQVVGMDYSLPTLRRALTADPARTASYVAGEAYHLPFTDHAFDMVLSIGVLQALDRTATALDEMLRVLRPTGMLILEFLNSHEIPYLFAKFLVKGLFDEGRIRRYSLTAVTDNLESRGMTLLSLVPVYLPPRRFPWMQRFFTETGLFSHLDNIPGFARSAAHAFLAAFCRNPAR
jgi:SAM-dependent methyltransferase